MCVGVQFHLFGKKEKMRRKIDRKKYLFNNTLYDGVCK